MGLRGELFSTRVLLQNRTYFFNVKENRLGDLYLNIVESKNREDGAFDRQSVILFADDLQEFLKGFDDSLRVLEKEMREKRRSSRVARGPREGPREGSREGDNPRGDSRGEEKGRARGGAGSGDRKDGQGRRSRADDRRPGPERPPRDRPSRDGFSPRDGQHSRDGFSPRDGYHPRDGGRPKDGSHPKDGNPKGGKRVVVRKR